MPSAAPPTPSFVSHLLPSLLSPSPSSASSSSPASSTRSSKRRRSSLASSTTSTLSTSTTATSLAPSSRTHQHPSTAPHPRASLIPPGAFVLSDGMQPQGTRIEKRKPRKIGTVEGWWIWYQGTYVSSMLETWEFVLIHALLLLLVILLSFALSYLPQHASLMAARVKYYISGNGVGGSS
ncbi:hypothetical protein JCM11251_002785 [Rhodosporidiobolus azoricus]